jgi:hypothetical protein
MVMTAIQRSGWTTYVRWCNVQKLASERDIAERSIRRSR